jgi:hypothetical protein
MAAKVPVICYSASKEPISGALPLKGKPTSIPELTRSLPAFNLKKSITGRLPSGGLRPEVPAVSILIKSLSAQVTGGEASQLL